MTRQQDDWAEYRNLVLKELKRLEDVALQIQQDVGSIKTELAVTRNELKLKAGLWGALAAAIPSAIAVIFILMKVGK